MLLRRSTPRDHEIVRGIHAQAFGRPTDGGEPPAEVALFDALTRAGDVVAALSLVAVHEEAPVGHVVCSRAAVADHAVVALGPIGVLPHLQRRGVGRALMHAVLGAADALEIPLVGLLGSPEYYPRFGFVPSARLGIDPPNPAWGDHFQVRVLARYHPGITGAFRYAPPFDAV